MDGRRGVWCPTDGLSILSTEAFSDNYIVSAAVLGLSSLGQVFGSFDIGRVQ